MIYKVEVYHSLRMGSYSEYYLVDAQDEEEAKKLVLDVPDIKVNKRVGSSDLYVEELDFRSPIYLYEN